jgi:UDP-N-acetylglucosamine 1-carboxyvinyltransferase
MTAVAAVSKGFSFISDSVFKTRHMHVPELQRMGAKIHIENGSIIVEGIPQLSGAPVRATDLRCAAALILAGLNADGETVVQEVDHVFRGYDQILEKLRSVGAEVEVVPSTNGNGKGPIG